MDILQEAGEGGQEQLYARILTERYQEPRIFLASTNINEGKQATENNLIAVF